jgi:DNA-binding IclR family transcriptional regulator
MSDGEWHQASEIAEILGLKDTRTKQLLRELVEADKLEDDGKTKGKAYRLRMCH